MATYRDMGTCDLRHLNDLEAINKIEEIRDIGILILPKDADLEIMSAFSAIPKRDVGEMLYLDKNVKLSSINGKATITKNMYAGEEVYLSINGKALIAGVAPDSKITFNINGKAIINTKYFAPASINSINGKMIEVEFDDYKLFNSVNVDKDMLEYIESNITIVAENEIDISDDVTVDILKEKSIKFVAGNTIYCHKNILGYIKATSTGGTQIVNKDEIVDEPVNEDDDDE